MRLFFWDFDDYNDIGREWALFTINILAVLFTCFSLVNTARIHRRCIFQLIPLSINALATITLLMLKLFEKGYEFDQIGYIIQIFTYFLFCYTFGQMHIKVVQQGSRIPLKMLCNVLLIIAAIFTLTMIGLVIGRQIAKDCDNNIFITAIFSFVTEVVSFIPTAYFGIDMLRKITKKQKGEMEIAQINSNQIFSLNSDEYVKERKKQISIVLFSYGISVVLRGFTIISSYLLDEEFACNNCEGVFIVTSDSIIGQFLLVLIQINQLIPHVIIPIALYIVPAKQTRKDVMLSESLIDQDDEEDNSEIVQRRISHGLLRKSSTNVAQISAQIHLQP